MQLMVSCVTTYLGKAEREACPIRPEWKEAAEWLEVAERAGKRGVY